MIPQTRWWMWVPPTETFPGHQLTCARIMWALVRMKLHDTRKETKKRNCGSRPVSTTHSWYAPAVSGPTRRPGWSHLALPTVLRAVSQPWRDPAPALATPWPRRACAAAVAVVGARPAVERVFARAPEEGVVRPGGRERVAARPSRS